MDKFDVIVVGAGPAGEVVAGRCADGGLSVVLVERELVGGECSYWGCVPSKTLIRPGDVLAAARRVPGASSTIVGGPDIAAAFAQRDYMTSGWSDESQLAWLRDHHITLARGEGRLRGSRTVEVLGSDGQVRALSARRAVVLATGTRPAMPPIPGLADVEPWDNRDATAVKALPRRLIVLGGGAIGVEMAQAFRRLGSEQVSVAEAAPTLLAREEPFAGEEVRMALEAEGVALLTGQAVQRVHRDHVDGPVVLELSTGHELVGDELLVATGRRPATDHLGLDSVGLTPARYIEVDDQLRAVGVRGNWLYAVGDCNGRAQLTHMGKYQARIAADVILGKDAQDRASDSVVPRVTFTDPQVCAVGLTESQARDRGIEVRAVTFGTGEVAGAYTQGVGIRGTSKLVIDESRRVLVGATFTGPGVQELLHAATVAIAAGLPLDQLWHAVPAFPTVSEVWLRLLETYGL